MTEEKLAEDYVQSLMEKDDEDIDKLIDENFGDLRLTSRQAGTLLGIIKGIGVCSFLAGGASVLDIKDDSDKRLEPILCKLKDLGIIKSWYYNGTFHAQ